MQAIAPLGSHGSNRHAEEASARSKRGKRIRCVQSGLKRGDDRHSVNREFRNTPTNPRPAMEHSERKAPHPAAVPILLVLGAELVLSEAEGGPPA
jgi:hypothetical protein